MASGASFQIDVGVQAAGVDSAATSLDKLSQKLTTTGSAAEQAAEESAPLSDTFKKVGEAAEAAGESTGINARKAAAGFGALGGPLGVVGQKVFQTKEAFNKLGAALGAGGPYAIFAVLAAAVVAGLAAMTAAAIATIAKITEWGVGLADAARNSRLLADGIARTTSGGAILDKKLNDLTNTLPLTREELSGMAQKLADAGFRGKDLANQLESTATKAAQLKFGPDFAKEMTSLDQQSKRLHNGISQIFGGLKIDKLLEQLSTLTDLFDVNSESGQAMKTVFESLFQPLVDGATGMIPKIRSAFLQFEILVLKALIAIKPWGSKILLAAEVIGVLVAVLIAGLAIAIGIVVVAVVAMIAFFAILTAAFFAVAAAVVWLTVKITEGLFAAVDWLRAKFTEAVNWLKSLSFTEIASNLIQGLIDGITGRATAVINAIKGVVGGAIDAAKKALGIASPSKVFAEIGVRTAAGMEQGLDRAGGGVQDAMTDMVAPPSSGASPLESLQGAKAAPISSGKGAASLQGVTFNFYGVEGAEDAEQRFAATLTRVLEGDVAQLGSAVPA